MPERPLLILFACANFAIGLGAFVAVGVLSPIAATFGLSKADAGWVMTAYSLAYAVSSPVLVALTGRIDRARLLTAALTLFAAAAAATAAAPNFTVMLIARGLMAVGAGLMTPVAAAIAATLTTAENRGKALSLVFVGFTVAQAIGVPTGSWIGYAFGWRWAFGAVTALAAIAAVGVFLKTPRGLRAPGGALSTLGATLVSPLHTSALVLTVCVFAAMYCVYTFIAPFLEQRYGLGRDGVSLLLGLLGVSGIAGNWLGGLLTDRVGPGWTVTLICASLTLLFPAATVLVLPLAALAVLTALWSLVGFAFMAAQQARLVSLDPSRASTLLALNAASIYLGGAIGAYAGGETLKAVGFAGLGPAAAVFTLLGLGSIALTRRPAASRP
jgi:predicted MFS family arabinose efflux permease